MSQYDQQRTARLIEAHHKRFSSAAMIIENATGEALIVKASYKPYWTFPGGIVDEDESPLDAACRETFEEVGLRVEPDSAEFVLAAYRRSSIAQSYQFVFRSRRRYTDDQSIIMETAEIEDYAFVAKDEVMTSNRHYGKVIKHWATDTAGYVEQTFGE